MAYTIALISSALDATSNKNAGFVLAGTGSSGTYAFTITSSGGAGQVTGSGAIVSDPQSVTPIDVSALPVGTLTFSVTVTDVNSVVGPAVTATATLTAYTPMASLPSQYQQQLQMLDNYEYQAGILLNQFEALYTKMLRAWQNIPGYAMLDPHEEWKRTLQAQSPTPFTSTTRSATDLNTVISFMLAVHGVVADPTNQQTLASLIGTDLVNP